MVAPYPGNGACRNRLANDRVVQCVEVSSGVSSSVTRTTSATVPSGNHDRRPRPLAITPTPATPSSLNRLRHRRTASESTPQRRAISSLATPSAAHNSALAWTTPRCGSDVERAIFSNEPRCSLDTDNEGALFMTRTPYTTRLFQRRTTSNTINGLGAPSGMSTDRPSMSDQAKSSASSLPTSTRGHRAQSWANTL